MSIAEEIEKLKALKENGTLSEEEFHQAKIKTLNGTFQENIQNSTTHAPVNENNWSTIIHLSQLCGFIFPVAGLIVPVILWLIKKDESPVINKHGRIVLNWILSFFVFGAISVLLIFVLVGIPLILALFVAGIAFPIIGAVKASDGIFWTYPLSIKFFRVDIPAVSENKNYQELQNESGCTNIDLTADK